MAFRKRLPNGQEAATEVLSADDLINGVADGGDAAADAAPTRPHNQGWGRLLQGNRVILVIAIVAVVSLVAGVLLSRFIVSPDAAAAGSKAPIPGLITVPVEDRELANDVTIRGDASFADSVDVKIETGDIGGPAIVTGQVPQVGATLNALSVALEVAGRPVIVLPGDLPVYRTLRIGVAGPDVLQLKQALSAVGLNPGDLGSNLFDSATASAVRDLYATIGYPAPDSPEGTAESVRSAADGVRSAEDFVASARHALAVAQSGPSTVDRVEQDNIVRAAERALATAQATGTPDEVADAQDALHLAQVRRDAVLAPKDVSAEVSAVNSAIQQLEAAREAYGEAQQGTLTFLPSSEVLYLPGLPRRVDEVTVSRGSSISGAVMRVSGATLEISASAAESDANLLEVGDSATLELRDGTELEATITSIEPREAEADSAEEGSRYDILLTPNSLTDEQMQQLQGTNVRISIPVSATDGSVLAVPLAALTAGPGGESRVEISTGDGDETVLIEVTTGLAAEGFVEITPVDGELEAGDLVVVGR